MRHFNFGESGENLILYDHQALIFTDKIQKPKICLIITIGTQKIELQRCTMWITKFLLFLFDKGGEGFRISNINFIH